MKLELRKAQKTDYEEIYQVLQKIFGVLLVNPLDFYISTILSKIYIIVDEDKIIGCLFLFQFSDVAYIFNGGILPEYQNKGIATEFLLDYFDKICKAENIKLVLALIQTDNKRSLAVVQKAGFKDKKLKIPIPLFGTTTLVYKKV